MKIYIRRVDYQAIHKQISILKDTVKGFFDNKEMVKIKGANSFYEGNVSILLSTDPRLGGDIKQIIKAEGGMTEGDFLVIKKIRNEYVLEIVRRNHSEYDLLLELVNEKDRHLEVITESFDNNKQSDIIGYNKIFYGIPGSGKSYYIEHTVLNGVDKENDVFRTTFYLDYSNSDFVGQIYPKTITDDEGNTKVTYQSIPGPFSKALKRAFEEKDRMIYLVIEEINRGNTAAIFGDTFQLLDRLNTDYDGRVAGDSEYPISNEFIEDYLGDLVKKGRVYIPHNLTILATMNTSDQNVFPLDTAFKRRWDRERVISNWDDCTIKEMYIPYTDITWKNFVETINSRMVAGNDELEMPISEDKKIGAYFARKDMLSSQENKYEDIEENRTKLKKFVNNVIDYLYNDVTKFDHTILFKENMTYDDIYKIMTEYKIDENQGGLFKNVLKEDILPDISSDPKNEKK